MDTPKLSRQERIKAALRTALELMNDEGRHWIKRSAKRELGKLENGQIEYGFCSLGALYEATIGLKQKETGKFVPLTDEAWPTYQGAANVLLRAVQKETDGYYDHVALWNDAKERTWADVRGTFERAISIV